jgi:hypothetical protein
MGSISIEEDSHVGYVYFVRCPFNGYIKIGYSWGNPESRFQVIQIHSPVPVERYAIMVGDETLEFKLHSRFDEHRDHGEWFKPSPELYAFIAEHTREWTAEVGKELRREDKRFPRRDRAGIVPVVTPPVPCQTPEPELSELSDEVSARYMLGLKPGEKPPKRRRLRYAPLQAMLDRLAADKDPAP